MSEPELSKSLEKLKKLQKKPDGVTTREWTHVLGKLQAMADKPSVPGLTETTKSKLAIRFMWLYFALILFSLLYPFGYNWLMMKVLGVTDATKLIDIKDFFMMISGVVTPLMAFVISDYFKGKN
jgi:hypothetical protein